jgi:tetratricopeptide (TPR) repeat protein
MLVRASLVLVFVLVLLGLALPPALDPGPQTATAAAGSTAADAGGTAADSSGSTKTTKSGLENYESSLKTWFSVVGFWIGALLVLFGLFAIAVLIQRRRKASLSIEPFGHSAVDAKVGTVLSGLVQKRLSDLSTRGDAGGRSYKLDFIVADVELLGESESLEKALAGLADTSQFKVVVAILGLVDRIIGRQLVAKGELAPPGEEGCGVVLSLQTQAKGIEASGSLWGDGTDRAQCTVSSDPAPYYALAERSAAWIQYEAARSLKANVDLITKSAKSFSLLSEALAQQRLNEIESAAELYAEAIEADRENVAALMNLSVLLARYYGRYDWAVGLLGLARIALRKRYREAEAR